MRQADHAMFIVTVCTDGEASGCLAGFVTQCSISPARYIVCLSVENRTFTVAREADALAVHMVPRGQRNLAGLFGGETGDEVDKFAAAPWAPGPRGTAVLDGLRNWFAAAIIGEWAVGDHHAFLVEPMAWSFDDTEEPLMYHEVSDMEPGHLA
jgi:flavin reductase (DIM6/NTAB) family NADH-FMN oxidoreductase RutF